MAQYYKNVEEGLVETKMKIVNEIQITITNIWEATSTLMYKGSDPKQS